MADLASTTTHTEDAHHGGSTGLPQLDSSSFASQLFWLTVIFVALYLLMSRNVVPRIRDVLEKRQNHITHDLDAAEKAKDEAAKAKASYEKDQASAREKANAMIVASQEAIARMINKAHSKLDSDIADLLQAAESRIAQQVEESREEIKPVVKELPEEIVKTLIRVKPDSQKIEAAVVSAMKSS